MDEDSLKYLWFGYWSNDKTKLIYQKDLTIYKLSKRRNSTASRNKQNVFSEILRK